jgi:hypothetical protein
VLAFDIARHHLKHFALAAGLANVRAFYDDPVTLLRVHGEPPIEALPSVSLSPQGLRAGEAVSSGVRKDGSARKNS